MCAYFTIFDRIDPDWAQEQAKEIFETMPCTQRGSNSGIFHSNYENWKFVNFLKKFENFQNLEKKINGNLKC